VLNIPELRGLIAMILDQRDPRVRLADDVYRQFNESVAQAVAAALGYDATPADWLEEWLVSFYLTEDSPADGGILADPQLDSDVHDEFMAGVAARRATPA
jgi:hypothetical protein